MPTLSYFVERKIKFKGDNQWYLQTLIYPAEEKSLCMIDILNAKDTRESHERWIAETVLGILRYCLKEKYDEEKSTVHQNRWALACMYPMDDSYLAWIFFSILHVKLEFFISQQIVVGRDCSDSDSWNIIDSNSV